MEYNVKFEDFILELDNFFSDEECDVAINYFENFSYYGMTEGRENQMPMGILMDDEQLYSEVAISSQVRNISLINGKENSPEVLSFDQTGPFLIFNERFWNVIYPIYTSKYSVIKNFSAHQIRHTKLQKTKPGQGYHLWHCEDSSVEVSRRIMTFILYLNDIDEGGETEFLYYSKRIKPKKGKIIVWPAGFTHTHRGNPPLTTEKYILTGWVEM